MKLSKLKLKNYRCFGSEEQVILIDQLTTFIGNNSTGKTAALSAINCMFSENSNDRILHRSDFHLPQNILPDEMEQQSLYIEAIFEFEELQSGSNGGEYAIPIFFQHFVVDNPGGLPYLRIRLEATWEKSNTIDGSIDSKISYITCPEFAEIEEGNRTNASRRDLDKIRVIYVPAVRDPSKQLKNASGTMMYQIMSSINWSEETKGRVKTKILAISFKTDAAQNLKERVEKRCGTDIKGRFVSMTYDAFAKNILDHFLYALPDELRPATDYLVNDPDIIDAAFHCAGFKNPNGFTQSRLKTEYDDILSRISLPLTGDGLGHKVWPLLLKGFNGNKATLTFKMIMMLAMYIIETNPYIKQALQMTYSFVFLDEFQDTTAIQYAFVKECFWNSGTKVTSVGDNKQRIMVWAGAVKTIFNDFYRELNPKCIRLIMNHRSAPRLVALQKAMYESLKEKATEVCASGNWAEDDGNIALFIADNEQLEAAAVSKDILLKISNGVEPHDICILCKQKPQDYASAVIEELEKHGVRARIETGYQDLIKEPIVDLFIKFMICADSRKHPNEWTFIEELLVELWGISGMRENDTFDEMQRKLSAVVNVVKKNIQQKLDTEQWHSTLNSIIDFFGIGNIKAKFPAYKQGTYFMNVINQFESLFFEEYVAAHGVWNLAIENFRGDHSVPIMTIHKSKGLEYNAVYFIGLEDSAFWNFRNQPDEDRCTFFVALSRAKASVTFTFCKKRSGMKCPMQRHNAINEFFDLLQRPGIAEVKRFQNR